MKILLFAFFICFVCISCHINLKNNDSRPGIILLLPDSVNNKSAKYDYDDLSLCQRVSKQLSLSNLQVGADSIELRLWISGYSYHANELIILKGVDTNWVYSDYEINFDRNYITDSNVMIAQCFAKSAGLNYLKEKAFIDSLQIDSAWTIPSQSQLNIPANLGLTDGTRYYLEITDRNRYKFICFSSPKYYVEKLHNERNHEKFLRCIDCMQYGLLRYNLKKYLIGW